MIPYGQRRALRHAGSVIEAELAVFTGDEGLYWNNKDVFLVTRVVGSMVWYVCLTNPYGERSHRRWFFENYASRVLFDGREVS